MPVRSRTRPFVVLAALFAVVVSSLGIQGTASAAAIPEPDQDPFYQPAAGYESATPGTVFRSRSVTVTGLGIPMPVRSTQYLTRSTDAKGQPIAVVSTLMVPLVPYFFGKRPLLSYQSAIDSLGDQCNPSYTLRTGTHAALGLMTLALLKGWAVVSTDYQGPRDAYGAGLLEGRAVLDGIRGAERLPGTGLAGAATPVGMWGYSGGGLATGWAAELAPTYAPELAIKGVASGGTPADLAAAKTLMDGSIFSGLFLAAAVGVSREYPEILSVLNDAGHEMVAQIGDMCASQEASSFAFRRISEFTTMPDPFSEPVVAAVLDANTMGKAAPTAPVYLYHSVFDELIPFSAAQKVHRAWCGLGGKVLLYADVLSEHNILAITGAPAAVAYLGSRFLGIPAPTNC